MATRSIEVQAQEIAESWINGNNTWVLNQVTQAKSKKLAALLAVKVLKILQGFNPPSSGDDFIRALHNRMVS